MMSTGSTVEDAMKVVGADDVGLPKRPKGTSRPGSRKATKVEESDAVVVAYVHSNNITYSWHRSMVELIGWDMAHECRVIRGGYIAIRYGTDGLAMGRNKAVLDFLAERKAQWLFWVDTDMGFPADTIDRLLEVADPVKRPIVGALCFSQREEVDDGLGGWRCRATPTVMDWTKVGEQMGFAIRFDYPQDTVTQVGGTGSAAILIHRSAFEKIEEKYGRAWYDRVPNTTTGQILSEDLAFCLRAGTLGIPVHVHTGVKTTHFKSFWLAEDDYFQQVAVASLSERGTAGTAPPATEPVAVIVPVLDRPENAKPFMASLRASTGLATVYAVCDVDDNETAGAWTAAGAEIMRGDDEHVIGDHRRGVLAHTFAEKVNLGFRQTREPWVFLVGDDVRFHPGWLDQALNQAKLTGAEVIGTNDLGNPRVIAGDHGTHLLVRRSYIDEFGASWDGPGIVAHEGYKHWYVDDEIVTVAKQRGVWAPAKGSIVEHLHPLFGKAEGDATYRLGQSFVDVDKALFTERLAKYGS